MRGGFAVLLCLTVVWFVPATGFAAGLAQAGSLARGDAAATVNGDKISVGEWLDRLQGMRAQDFFLSTNPVRMKGGTAGQIALESLITGRLILQYAAKTSLMPADAEVAAQMAMFKARPDVAQGLTAKAFTEDQLKQDVRLQLALYSIATINQTIAPNEEQAYYDKHPEQFGTPERWHLSVIRVPDQAVLARAQAALKSGTPFEAVASQFSNDPATKDRGGDMGVIAAGDPSLPAFVREAVAKLKVGELTPPLQPSQGGAPIFLVRLTGRDERSVPPLEKVKDQVHRLALYEKAGGSGAADKKLADFRKTAIITIALPGYESMAAAAR